MLLYSSCLPLSPLHVQVTLLQCMETDNILNIPSTHSKEIYAVMTFYLFADIPTPKTLTSHVNKVNCSVSPDTRVFTTAPPGGPKPSHVQLPALAPSQPQIQTFVVQQSPGLTSKTIQVRNMHTVGLTSPWTSVFILADSIIIGVSIIPLFVFVICNHRVYQTGMSEVH